MNEMSLEEQIRCMREMREYLEDFCIEMNRIMVELSNEYRELRRDGLPVETVQTYEQRYYNPADDQVRYVIGDIRSRHFDYIDRVIERLERALNEQ